MTDIVERLRQVAAFLKGRKVSVERAAIWYDWEIVSFRDYDYQNPDNAEPSP
jgi:hypothetical protein